MVPGDVFSDRCDPASEDVSDHQHKELPGSIESRLCYAHTDDLQINRGSEQIMANERSCPVTAPVVYDLTKD